MNYHTDDLRKDLGLTYKDLVIGDFEESKNIIFHLHGAVGGSRNALEIMERNNDLLVATLQISPDLRDMPSCIRTKESLSYSHEQVSKKFEKLLTHAPDKNIILHGNSFGGSLALGLGYNYSNDIAGVILNSSSGFGEVLDNRFGNINKLITSITKHDTIIKQYEVMKDIISKLIDMNPESIKNYMIEDALDLALVFDSTIHRYTKMNKIQILKFREIIKFLAHSDNLAQSNPEQDLHKVKLLDLADKKIPLLFVGGESDTVTSAEVVKYQAGLVGQEAIIFPSVGHSSHMEAPDKWIQSVNVWMQENRIGYIKK